MRTPSNTVALGLMAKYWEVGRVKTRLGKDIGLTRAACLHRSFVVHLCESLSTFPGRRVVCMAPSSRRDSFVSELRSHELDHTWETMEQADGSLGNRMEQWFDAVFRDPRRPASCAILIGADCPTLSLAQIQEAQDQLANYDVVLGPATDGGYYLIGVSAPWIVGRFHSIFDEVPWSTHQVLRITLQRIAAAGLSCYQLQEREDIDTMAELNRLRQQLAALKANDTSGEPSKRWSKLGEIIEKILVDDVDCLEPTGCRP